MEMTQEGKNRPGYKGAHRGHLCHFLLAKRSLYLVGPRAVSDSRAASLCPFVLRAGPLLEAGRQHHVRLRPPGALAFDFLANYVGLVCLGGAFFIGVGGYLTAIFNVYLGFPFYLSIPPGDLLRRDSLHRAPPSVPAASGRLFRHRDAYVSRCSSRGSSRRLTSWAARTASPVSIAFPSLPGEHTRSSSHPLRSFCHAEASSTRISASCFGESRIMTSR